MTNKKIDINKFKLSPGANFHENISAEWAQGYEEGSFDRRRTCFRSILNDAVAPCKTWLDLGCGSGVLTQDLLERGAVVVAVDASPGMLREAQSYIDVDNVSVVTWLQSDVQSLPQLTDASFDGVLCSSVLEYLEHPVAALGEAARLLRPGGKLIVSMPPKLSIVRMSQKVVRAASRLVGGNKYSYLAVSIFEIDPRYLEQWLSDAGFVLERVTEFDPFLPSNLLTMLRPALLIIEAHKKPC
jgi:2-polyprenyl-6-hydroxyphenyl methylase/3-demethylubiquinone-9 3-methyltransferase